VPAPSLVAVAPDVHLLARHAASTSATVHGFPGPVASDVPVSRASIIVIVDCAGSRASSRRGASARSLSSG
jgi:hypothetical protein